MKSLLLATILLTSPMAASAALAQTVPGEWKDIATFVGRSIVFIQTAHGSCTGFVINDDAKSGKDNKDSVDLVLTAAHCDGPELYADQRPAIIRTKDSKKDLMVIEVENLDRPALKLNREAPEIGADVASYGYGYGFDRPLFRVAHISDDKLYIPYDGVGGPLFVIDAAFVSGQSGGPVVDRDGKVVMIVQMGTAMVGFGVGSDVIHDKVGRFFGKTP